VKGGAASGAAPPRAIPTPTAVVPALGNRVSAAGLPYRALAGAGDAVEASAASTGAVSGRTPRRAGRTPRLLDQHPQPHQGAGRAGGAAQRMNAVSPAP